jgi:hypothetical protein
MGDRTESGNRVVGDNSSHSGLGEAHVSGEVTQLDLDEVRRRLDFLADQRLARPPTFAERREWDQLARREMDLLRSTTGR